MTGTPDQSAPGKRGRVTVLVPCYNGDRYLVEMLASLDAQLFRDYCVVFVDDGSTDRTAAILNSYAAEHDNSIVVHLPLNGGVCRALNEGLKHIVTELAVVFAADDVMLPNLLADAVTVIEDASEDCGAVAFPVLVADANATIRTDETGAPIVYSPPSEVSSATPPSLLPLLVGANVLAGVALFRTAILRDIGYDERSPIEDWRMWCKIAQRYRIAVAPRPMFINRDTPLSLDKRLKHSGQRYVAGATVRAEFAGDHGAIDEVIVAQTKNDLNILLSRSLRTEARQVLHILDSSGLERSFLLQRYALRLPSPALRFGFLAWQWFTRRSENR